jgi:hypothetical protein
MKTICAWCHKVLIEDEVPEAAVSHGICPDCLNGLVGGSEISLADFLNTIEFPVLVTDESVAVRQANEANERVLGKPVRRLEGSRIGVAIEYYHAGAKGECGGDAFCAGCVLRRTINETDADGKPRYGVYSDHEVATADGKRARRFRFSTTKAGNAVLLAIEGIQDLPIAS